MIKTKVTLTNLLIVSTVILASLLMYFYTHPTYHTGDTVRITSHAIMNGKTLEVSYKGGKIVNTSKDLYGRTGTIEGMYEYNNYHETNTHTGYLISFNHTDVEFDQPTFTLVKHN